MRKIFSILVTLMVIGLTFMSCTPTTGNIDTGSSTGSNTTISSTLKEFINNTFEDVDWTDSTSAYSGKIKGTENDYVLIPAKASVPNNFRKVDDKTYSFGDAELYKNSIYGINIYLYLDGDAFFSIDGDGYLEGDDFFYFDGPDTIGMSSTMMQKYFDYDENTNEYITIGGKTFNIKY